MAPLPFFQCANEALAGIGKTDEPVTGERRTGRHPERRKNGGVAFDQFRCDDGQVLGKGKALLNALNGFPARFAVCFRRELHEPLVELINRGAGIRLPQVGLIGIDGHRLALLAAPITASVRLLIVFNLSVAGSPVAEVMLSWVPESFRLFGRDHPAGLREPAHRCGNGTLHLTLPQIFPPATDKPHVSRFFEQAAGLLEVVEAAAESGQPASDWTIVVAREGGIRMLAGGSDWSLEALEQEHGARMVFRIRQQRGAIRVEGRAGARTCLFEAAKPDRAARLLLRDERMYEVVHHGDKIVAVARGSELRDHSWRRASTGST